MMPMLDAFNHSSRASTVAAFDGEQNCFTLTTTTPLRRGEEAFISYGEKSNDELLQLFGFVEAENPHDAFLSVGLDSYLASAKERFFTSEAARADRFQRLAALGLDGALLG